MTGHTFLPIKLGSNRCRTCGGWVDASYHSAELWSDVDREREAVRMAEEAEKMARLMRTPKGSVNEAAGLVERKSPLFFGSGQNPSLFGGR